MEILSMADWQGSLILAFHKLDQAFKNDECRNNDTDFQRGGTFPLVSSKLNWTQYKGKSTRKKLQGAEWNSIEDASVTEIVNENLPSP